jgi:hypothetical protein
MACVIDSCAWWTSSVASVTVLSGTSTCWTLAATVLAGSQKLWPLRGDMALKIGAVVSGYSTACSVGASSVHTQHSTALHRTAPHWRYERVLSSAPWHGMAAAAKRAVFAASDAVP